jgi:hypothetical protein
MLFAVHHSPYNITMLFIESSEDGEYFVVGPGLLYSTFCYFYFVFFSELCAASALF